MLNFGRVSFVGNVTWLLMIDDHLEMGINQIRFRALERGKHQRSVNTQATSDLFNLHYICDAQTLSLYSIQCDHIKIWNTSANVVCGHKPMFETHYLSLFQNLCENMLACMYHVCIHDSRMLVHISLFCTARLKKVPCYLSHTSSSQSQKVTVYPGYSHDHQKPQHVTPQDPNKAKAGIYIHLKIYVGW